MSKRKLSRIAYTILNKEEEIREILDKADVKLDKAYLGLTKEKKLAFLNDLIKKLSDQDDVLKEKLINLHPDFDALKVYILGKEKEANGDIKDTLEDATVNDEDKPFLEKHKEAIKGGLIMLSGLAVLKFLIGATSK